MVVEIKRKKKEPFFFYCVYLTSWITPTALIIIVEMVYLSQKYPQAIQIRTLVYKKMMLATPIILIIIYLYISRYIWSVFWESFNISCINLCWFNYMIKEIMVKLFCLAIIWCKTIKIQNELFIAIFKAIYIFFSYIV